MPSQADSSSPRRGPRTSGPSVEALLLDAAATLLAEKSPGEISIRALSEHADVSPAMVSYYFGSKDGLFRALLAEGLEDLITHLEARVVASTESSHLPTLTRAVVEAVGRKPWLPMLVLRGVLMQSGSERDRFLAEFAPRLSSLLGGALEADRSAGSLREDVDPQLAFLSVLGMTIYPYLARPIAERVLALSYDETFPSRLADHTERLVRSGLLESDD